MTRGAARAPGPARTRGYILLAVVVVLAVLAALSLALNLDGGIQAVRGDTQARSDRARYVAEAGIAHALARASRSECQAYDLPATPFGSDLYAVDFTPEQGSPVRIESVATLADGTRHQRRREAVRVYETTRELVLQPAPDVAEDVYLYQAKSDWNYGANNQLRVTGWSGSGTRSLLRFDLSTLPPGVEVLDARLEVHQVRFASGGGPVTLHRVDTDWLEGSSSGASGAGASWTTRDGTLAWTSAGGDYQASFQARVQMPSTSASTASWQVFTVTGLVDAWINGGEANHGLILVPETTSTDVYLYSSDETDSTLRPRLVVRYTCECGTTPGYLLELAPGASQGRDTYIGNPNGAEEGRNFGNRDQVWVGTGRYNGLFRFDLSSLPAAARILAADLILNLEAVGSGTSGDVNAHRLTRDWLEGDGTSGANWQTHDGIQAWAQAGGDYDPAPAATTLVSATAGTTLSWNLAGLVREWHAGDQPNHGVLLREVDGVLYNLKFTSSDSADAGNRPRLRVEYTCPCGVDCTPTAPPEPVYLDRFAQLTCDPLIDFSGSDGGLDWSPTPWSKVGESSDSCTGNARIAIDGDSNRVRFGGDGDGLERAADLSLFAGAALTLDYRREELNDASQAVTVEVSTDAGVSWAPIGEIGGVGTDASYQSASFDLSAHVSADFRLRLLGRGLGFAQGKNRVIFVDDVQIAGISGSTCNADYTPNLKLDEFLSNGLGAPNPRGLTFIRPGSGFLGQSAPANGAWLGVDKDNGLFLVDLDGVLLASAALPAGDASGLTRVLSGSWQGHAAVVFEIDRRLDYIAADGSLAGSWSTATAGVDAPTGVASIGATASGSRDGQLALADRATTRVVFTADDGSLIDSLDLTALGLDPLTDLAHLPGTDKLLLSFEPCTAAVVDFEGNLLRQFDTCGFGATRLQALAVNPLTCVQAAVDADLPGVVSLIEMDLGGGGGGEALGGGEGLGPGAGCDASFADQFDNIAFNNSNGDAAWATDWLEINEADGAAAGDIQVLADTGNYQLQVRDNDGGGEGLQRELDLSGFASADLNLVYRRDGLDDAQDYVSVSVSADGGANWTELGRLAGPATDAAYASASYALAGHLSATTRIRLLGSADLGQVDQVYFDNIQVCAMH